SGGSSLATRWAAEGSGNRNFNNFFANYQNQWVHVLVVLKQGTVSAYRNGHFVAAHGTIVPDRSETSYAVNIGRRSGSSLSWEGKIDDTRIYNYARTPAQVAWDYSNGKP